MQDLVDRLRAMARAEHDDLSMGDEAADAILELLATLQEARPYVHTGLQQAKLRLARSLEGELSGFIDAQHLLGRIDRRLDRCKV